MIVVTGSAGFIASYLVDHLNGLGHTDLILVDDFSFASKEENWIHTKFQLKIDRAAFIPWFETHADQVDFVFHFVIKWTFNLILSGFWEEKNHGMVK